MTWAVVLLTYRGQSILHREQWLTEAQALECARKLRAHWSRVYIAELIDIDQHRTEKLKTIMTEAPTRDGKKRR